MGRQPDIDEVKIKNPERQELQTRALIASQSLQDFLSVTMKQIEGKNFEIESLRAQNAKLLETKKDFEKLKRKIEKQSKKKE